MSSDPAPTTGAAELPSDEELMVSVLRHLGCPEDYAGEYIANGGAAVEELRKTVRIVRASIVAAGAESQRLPEDTSGCLYCDAGFPFLFPGIHDSGLGAKGLPCALGAVPATPPAPAEAQRPEQ